MRMPHYLRLLPTVFAFFLIMSPGLLATNISGHITQNDTLTLADSPYVLTADVIVDSLVTLVIEPGVQINLSGRYHDFIVRGTLIAEGTSTDNIRFFSNNQYGGGSLAFIVGSHGSLLHVELNKLGVYHANNAYDCALYINKADVTVDHCVFLNNQNDVRATASSVGGFGPNNSLKTIYLFDNSLTKSCVWPNADSEGFQYEFFGDLTLALDDSLTIMPGVSVNLSGRYKDLRVNGTLIAEGNIQDSIHFYSSTQYGGGSVAFLQGSKGNLSHTEFRRLGIYHSSNAYDCALYINKAEVTVNHCVFNSNSNDVRATASAVGLFGPSNSLETIYLFENSLTESCIWPNADTTGFKYELFGDLTLALDDSLTIMPGVSVNFSGRYKDLHVNGTLIAEGNTQDSIHFYSSTQYGGGSVAFLEGSTANLSYTKFRRLGIYHSSNAYDCALYINKAFVTLDHSSFYNNQNDVRSTASSVNDFGPNNSLTGIYFFENSLIESCVWPNVDSTGFKYYLFGDLTLPVNKTLVIQPGVDVELPNRFSDFHIYGALIAEGAEQDPIRFYSGGQYGGGSIAFLEGSTGDLLNAEFNKLGVYHSSNTYDCALYINKANVTVDKCNFVNNQNDVRATASSVNNFGPNNNLNTIYLFTNSLTESCVWPNADKDGFKYYLFGDMTLLAGDTLSIAPGVKVDLPTRFTDMHINGTMIAEGTELDSIRFFSSSVYGGGSIALLEGSTGNRFKYTHMEKLGVYNSSNTYDCALSVQAPCEITNSTIRNNARGIWINADVSPVIRENRIFKNSISGIQVSQAANPSIAFNSIEDNTWGLFSATDTINACNNYWGDPSGPFNAVNNPNGLGNKITDNVIAADCFLTEPTYISIDPTITQTSCIGDSNGSISLAVTGGRPPYAYAWSTGSMDTIISNLAAGEYSVTVTGAESLMAIENYIITDPPQVTITVVSDTICFGDSLVLVSNFANTTLWSTGDTTEQITVSPTTTTSYTLSGEYGDNCPYTETITVAVIPYNPPGEVTGMLPADGAMNLLPPLNLSWIPTNNTTHYDLYIWLEGTARPATPTVAGIASINYEYTGVLQYAVPYNWQLISKNGCFATEGIVQQFSLRELPDIVVSTISTPSDAVFSGQTLSIDWIVDNTGLGQTLDQQWIDAVYISTDETFESGTDIYLGGFSNFEALNPTENYIRSADFTLPNGIEGNYYVFVSTDHYGSLLEADNSNNVSSSPSPILIELSDWPDLVVSTVSVLGNTTVFAGGTADIEYEVTNDVSYEDPFSGGTVIYSWKDRIYLSQDTLLDGSDYLLKTINHTQADSEQLMAGESYIENQTVNIPNIYIENTRYYILVSTDIRNRVYEYLFDYNNTSASDDSITLIYLPANIRPESMTGPATANNKDLIAVNWTGINDGVGAATNNWYDRVYLSTNTDNSIAAGDLQVSSQYTTRDLAVGETYSRQKSIIVPPAISGTYYFKVRVDANDHVNELDKEDDNILVSSPIDILNADLLPVSLTGPSELIAGQTAMLDWTVSNIGLGKINSSNWEEVFYLSPIATFDSTAIQVASFNQNAVMESGDSISRSINFTLPEDLTQGNYYWIIKTNSNDGVFENGNTLNNVYTSMNPIFIEALPPADLAVIQIYAPDTTIAGSNINVGFTVMNNGPGSTSPIWVDRIYLSASPVWIHQDSSILLKQFAVNEFIAADSSYNQQTTLSLPMLPGGINTNTCYLYAFTNANSNLYESGNTTNNILRSDPIYVTAPNTDLDVFCFMLPLDTISAGSTIDIRWTVENKGDSTGLNNYWYWYDGVYLSTDTLFDESDLFVFDYAIYSTDVENNRYRKVEQPLEIPNGISGDYYMFMVADHTDLNYDVDFENNASLRTLVDGVLLRDEVGLPKPVHFVLPPSPDLRIQNFDAPMEGVSGQPITVDWTIKNNGDGATTGEWNDKVYLSTDLTLDDQDVLLLTHPSEGALAVGDMYSVNATDVFLPINASGVYVLIFATDADDTEYEHDAESNNILTTFITIEQPMPSDLVVTDISNPIAGTVGDNFSVSWTIKNRGSNPATGFMREAVYLSTDTIMDTNDVLVGTLDNTINLPPLATATHTLNTLLPGIELGEYYLLVETDLLNNILETDEENNGLVSDDVVDVDIAELPLNVLTPNVLQNDIPLYYRVEIADSLSDETLQIQLLGDSIAGSNEVYISFASTPSRVEYDHAELVPYLGNQELIVPNLVPGTYYLMVHGLTSAAAQQDISLLATILEFGVRSIDADQGGNTGMVTVRINGARFEDDMSVILDNGSAGLYIANEVIYIDPTQIYARFDLAGANVGEYDVRVRRDDGVSAVLIDGFTIVEGSQPSLVISIDHPPNTRLNRIVPMTIHVVNDGLTDVPVREVFAVSTQGAPLGRTVSELEEGRTDIPIDLHVPGEPLDVIRPGATVSVTFYTLSNSPMRFQLVDIN